MKKSVGALAILTAALLTSPAPGRTITLSVDDLDEMAVLNPAAPRLGWGMPYGGPGFFHTRHTLLWTGKMTLLMRYPIQELIPAGQRITKAEFGIKVLYIAGQPAVQISRMLAEWGPGVCYQYRTALPKKTEWAQPGARGAAVDRAAKVTATLRIATLNEYTADVTEDVELWYTGAAANRGWHLAFENDGTGVFMVTPYPLAAAPPKEWRLQITFEPK